MDGSGPSDTLDAMHSKAEVLANRIQTMADLEIPRNTNMDGPADEDTPVFGDYPFFIFGFRRAFHGRTLGVLALTQSKKAQQFGYPKLRWVRHLEFNGDNAQLEQMIDDRPITEILDADGGVKAISPSLLGRPVSGAPRG